MRRTPRLMEGFEGVFGYDPRAQHAGEKRGHFKALHHFERFVERVKEGRDDPAKPSWLYSLWPEPDDYKKLKEFLGREPTSYEVRSFDYGYRTTYNEVWLEQEKALKTQGR